MQFVKWLCAKYLPHTWSENSEPIFSKPSLTVINDGKGCVGQRLNNWSNIALHQTNQPGSNGAISANTLVVDCSPNWWGTPKLTVSGCPVSGATLIVSPTYPRPYPRQLQRLKIRPLMLVSDCFTSAMVTLTLVYCGNQNGSSWQR